MAREMVAKANRGVSLEGWNVIPGRAYYPQYSHEESRGVRAMEDGL
jgi:hypothetical protein